MRSQSQNETEDSVLVLPRTESQLTQSDKSSSEGAGTSKITFLFKLLISLSDLCPFCDKRLPDPCSPTLDKLLLEITAKATRDPRPRNANGLKAPLSVFASFCSRHEWESKIVPLAEKRGWPKVVDWDNFQERIKEMKVEMEVLLYDHVFVTTSRHNQNEARVRNSSHFWVQALKTISKQGRMKGDVQSRMANFDQSLPGYYGELGYAIILETIQEMFPADDLFDVVVEPMNVQDFFEYVLIPEVAVRLIMEDMDLKGQDGMAKAVKIAKESWSYGSQMFPAE
ncbi:hypothetical protein K435DRAFT_681005 [Dendrothele bispora CBS 962.96]|uniref:Restriction of telomere capping protein 4 n=1 Tax=Dendrothele bispora (strain CBS 962.96) TaxID=1314807 RepID=A0A4S8LFQ6_DENBC|nr:hypothetical protein K435DRAFT_681005 [Dendrothele bispora CBS 962.96]